jgi:hypothetical protein
MTDLELVDHCAQLAGGRAALARQLGKAKSTVSSWFTRGEVPGDVAARLRLMHGLPGPVTSDDGFAILVIVLRRLYERTEGRGWEWQTVRGVIETVDRVSADHTPTSAPVRAAGLGA